MPDWTERYLHTVVEQIRWKRAGGALAAELRTHLLDQRDACLAEGLEESDAEAEALRQMGDPVAVGAELDRVHRPRPQWGLLGLTLALALAGGFLRVWLTAEWPHDAVNHALSPVQTVQSVLLGSLCLLGGYLLDYSALGRHPKTVYAGALVLGILCLRHSPVMNGASYFTRYAVLLYPVVYAVWLYGWRGKGWRGLFFSVAGGVPLLCIALLAPYLTGALVLLTAGFAMLLAAVRADWFGIPARQGTAAVGGLGLALAVCGAWAAVRGYGRTRLALLLHPELDPLGGGYTALMVRDALSGARWIGEGAFGPSRTYEAVMPAAGSDLLLTTVIHKLGWLPFLVLAAVFTGLLGRLLVRCLRQKNQLGRMIGIAVVLALGMQAGLSLTFNLGFTLFSGHFPLVIGNHHTVLDMALIGLALSVFRQETLPAERMSCPASPAARPPRIAWRDGELVISLGRRG